MPSPACYQHFRLALWVEGIMKSSENISNFKLFMGFDFLAIQSQDFPNFKRDNVLRAAISK